MAGYISTKTVPNQYVASPIAIIGDFPDEDSISAGVPFSGKVGDKLEAILSACGLSKSSVNLLNLCQHRPADNNFDYIAESSQLSKGIEEVKNYLNSSSRPQLVFLLGQKALEHILRESPISDWRSSPIYNSTQNILYLPTYHPNSIFRIPANFGYIIHDIRKGLRLKEAGYKGQPNYDFNLNPRGIALEQAIEEILSVPRTECITLDIETKKKEPTSLRCVGFGLSSNKAIVLGNNGTPDFQQALDRIFTTRQGYTYQNGLFDREALRLYSGNTYKLTTDFDTHIASHVLEPELPRDLGFLTQGYTDIPCYWADITFSDDVKSSSDKTPFDKLLRYNAYDCVATYQIAEAQKIELAEKQNLMSLFKYELEMLDVSLHISQAGFAVDVVRLGELRTIVERKLQKCLTYLFILNGQRLINFNSPKQVQALLYDELKLPVQRKKEGGVTSDDAALVKLIGHCSAQIDKYKTESTKQEWRNKLAVLKLIQQVRGYEKLVSSYLDIKVSPDNRVRSTWKVGGTETGRWSCGLYIDGTGLNAQTFPRLVIEDDI